MLVTKGRNKECLTTNTILFHKKGKRTAKDFPVSFINLRFETRERERERDIEELPY